MIRAGLYITATPIGNLGDMTLRAIEVMKKADIIYCEDTRVSGKLMAAFDITAPLRAYHDHNGHIMRPEIKSRLEEGQIVVLISDAGTPLISDPGYKLVRDMRDIDLPVFTLPGASAVIAALSICGAPTDQFFFGGFVAQKEKARIIQYEEVAKLRATLTFYETGPRLVASLEAAMMALGDRHAAVARELTKMHEEIKSSHISELIAHYKNTPAKGEIVLIFWPPEARVFTEEDIRDLLRKLLAEHRVKDAAKIAASETGRPQKDLYRVALDIKNEDQE